MDNMYSCAGKPICYIFGYGSLISSKSRQRTCPLTAPKWLSANGPDSETAGPEATESADNPTLIPVRVKGLCRSWGFKVANNRPYTAVSVHQDPESFCCGVLFPMHCANEVARLDVREEGYMKIQLQHSQIEPWSDNLNVEQYIISASLDRDADTARVAWENESHGRLFAQFASQSSKKHKVPSDCPIYVYLVDLLVPPSPAHPMVQTYIDVCLLGCFEHGVNFAREFILSTWRHAAHMVGGKAENAAICAEYNSFGPWYDDRAFKYPFRHSENKIVGSSEPATLEFAKARTTSEEALVSSFQLIDSILQTCVPSSFKLRQPGLSRLDHS